MTGVEVLDTSVDDNVIVVNVRLSANLRSLTIEQVVAKMQTSNLSLLDTISDSLRFAGAPADSLSPLHALRSEMSQRGPTWFSTCYAQDPINSSEPL